MATGEAAAGLTQSVTTLLGGGAGASMAGTGASAAFQTLVTQAGISLANNQGNIGKTLKDLGSSSSVRSLVTAAGTAGLTYGLSEALGISEAGTSVGGQLQKSAVQAGVSTGFSIITQDQSLGEALLQGVINVGANTAGGLGAKYIGGIYVAGNIDALTHKALHALLGAIVGAASNLEDPGKGAAGGAIGAVGAELVAENLPTSIEPQTRADAGLAVGTALAVAAGQDGNAAILAATNAVQNNCLGVHYSPDPEAAEWERKQEIQGAQIIADAAGTKAPGFSEANEVAKKGANALFDFYDNLPLIEHAPLPIQVMRCMRAPTLMGIDFVLPSTMGEVVLLGAGGVAGKATKAPAMVEEIATAAVKGGRKLISEITPFLAKTPTPKSVSGLDIAAPKKVVAPKTSVKPLATEVPAMDSTAKAPIKKRVTFKSSVEPSAKAAGKPFPGTDVAPKPILKSSSSTKKAPTSYEKTSSKPASSISRSPQAPSTAPPGIKTSTLPKTDVMRKAKAASSVPVKPSSSTPALEAKPKGVHNPKTKKSLDYGKQKHREFDESLPKSLGKKSIRDEHGKLHIPDKHTESVVHELKPGTVTGVKKGLQQVERYERASKKPGILHLYEPEGKPIDLDSIVQKNFRADPVVQKVLETLK